MNSTSDKGEQWIEKEEDSARVFLTLSAIGWGLHFLLWKSGLPSLKLFGVLFLMGAIVISARALFHLITVGIIRLPKNAQNITQAVIGLLGAAIPYTYLCPNATNSPWGIIVQAFEPFTRSLVFWLPMILFVSLVYTASSIPSFLEVRRYLILVVIVFVIVFIGGHGGFDTDYEDGYSSSAHGLDPKSIEGQTSMATSYIRLIILGYGTLLFSGMRTRALNRQMEIAWRKAHVSQ